MRVLVLVVVGCGRIDFDQAPPDRLRYGQQHVLVYNDKDASLTVPAVVSPKLFGFADDFAIEPDLTAATGLDFNPVTGVVSGAPTQTSPLTAYTITASSDRGTTQGTLELRTVPGFYVTNHGDDHDARTSDSDCATASGKCSLRAALEQNNAFADDVVRAMVVASGTIELTEELFAQRSAELIGNGRDFTIIDASSGSRAIRFADDLTGRLASLTIRNGKADQGGCIYLQGGSYQLDDIAVLGCSATDSGGGIVMSDNFGSTTLAVTITSSVFRGNQAGGQGGALDLDNTVGSPRALITNTAFVDNEAAAAGGAIFYSGGALIVERTLFAGNTGFGGGMFGADGSDITLIDDTFTGNHGLRDSGGAMLTNNAAVLHLESCTIADNDCMGCFGGAGIRQFTGGTLDIESSIVSANVDLDDGKLSNCSASAVSLGHNLSDSAPGIFAANATDRYNIDPLLLPLGDNGGPTLTRAIDVGSPAVDHGASCPEVDQRGKPRPAGVACDVGAFELQ